MVFITLDKDNKLTIGLSLPIYGTKAYPKHFIAYLNTHNIHPQDKISKRQDTLHVLANQFHMHSRQTLGIIETT